MGSGPITELFGGGAALDYAMRIELWIHSTFPPNNILARKLSSVGKNLGQQVINRAALYTDKQQSQI
ncbi:hypothetical protein BDV3_002558 [Batrachochytrium dendrobatidis]